MIRWLLNPQLFNYVILSLYAMNSARWAVEQKWADSAYWFCCLLITLVVVFMYKH